MFLFSVYLNSSHTSCLSIMYIVYSNYLFRLLYCVEFNKNTFGVLFGIDLGLFTGHIVKTLKSELFLLPFTFV